jgi:hypothetical protein
MKFRRTELTADHFVGVNKMVAPIIANDRSAAPA